MENRYVFHQQSFFHMVLLLHLQRVRTNTRKVPQKYVNSGNYGLYETRTGAMCNDVVRNFLWKAVTWKTRQESITKSWTKATWERTKTIMATVKNCETDEENNNKLLNTKFRRKKYIRFLCVLLSVVYDITIRNFYFVKIFDVLPIIWKCFFWVRGRMETLFWGCTLIYTCASCCRIIQYFQRVKTQRGLTHTILFLYFYVKTHTKRNTTSDRLIHYVYVHILQNIKKQEWYSFSQIIQKKIQWQRLID